MWKYAVFAGRFCGPCAPWLVTITLSALYVVMPQNVAEEPFVVNTKQGRERFRENGLRSQTEWLLCAEQNNSWTLKHGE